MSQPILEFDYSAAEITGARSYQEDSFQIWRPNTTASKARPLLAVLADGMGGHVSGEVASRLATGQYIKAFSSEQGSVIQRLDHSLHAGNDALLDAIRSDARLAGMGCTIVAAYIDQDGLRWASVGDSMLLLFRDNQLKRLNADHSFGALLDKQAEARIISPEEAKKSPQRHTLRSALTGSPIPIKQVEARPYALRSGDWVVLASDGLETLSGNSLARLVDQHKDSEPTVLVEALLKAVAEEGAPRQDNTSIIAIRVLDMDDLSTHILSRRDATTTAGSAPTQATGLEGVVTADSEAGSWRSSLRTQIPRPTAFIILIICMAAALGIAFQRYMATRPPATAVEAAMPSPATVGIERVPSVDGDNPPVPAVEAPPPPGQDQSERKATTAPADSTPKKD